MLVEIDNEFIDVSEKVFILIKKNFKNKIYLKNAIRITTSHLVARYLICNTYNRLDGSEKALVHRELCEIFVAVFCNVPLDLVHRKREKEYQKVHLSTQKLTGYLDTSIGFPINSRPDYDKLKPKFFNKFYSLAVKALI